MKLLRGRREEPGNEASYLADAGKARPDPDPMQAENADSAGLTQFPIRPATFARSAARACAVAGAGRIYIYIYIYIVHDSASVESRRGGSLTLAPIITANM